MRRLGKLFLMACLLAGSFATLWLAVGEPWEILADGAHYVEIYRGEPAAAPFGYRVLTPLLARVLPWGMDGSFFIVTIACLVLAGGVLGVHAARVSGLRATGLLACAFWGLSFPFVYYATTGIRADAPMLLLLVVAYVVSVRCASVLLLLALVAVGMLAHELMLILLPALWLDKVFAGTPVMGQSCRGAACRRPRASQATPLQHPRETDALRTTTGGARYGWWSLVVLAVGALGFLVFTHWAIPVKPGALSYDSMTPKALLAFVLQYSGGLPKHAMRIYAAWGPALVFAGAWLVRQGTRGELRAFVGLFLVAVAATFLATDTLRVMEVLYVPVCIYAAAFVGGLWQAGRRWAAVIAVAVQAAYAFVVFGHLRTFETSPVMNGIAAGLSVAAVGFWLLERRGGLGRFICKSGA